MNDIKETHNAEKNIDHNLDSQIPSELLKTPKYVRKKKSSMLDFFESLCCVSVQSDDNEYYDY